MSYQSYLLKSISSNLVIFLEVIFKIVYETNQESVYKGIDLLNAPLHHE